MANAFEARQHDLKECNDRVSRFEETIKEYVELIEVLNEKA